VPGARRHAGTPGRRHRARGRRAGARGGGALPVTLWLFAGARAFQLPGGVRVELLELSLDLRVMAVAIAAALFATLLTTVLAGAFGFSADPSSALRSRAGATPRIERRRTRAVMVAAQVAVAVVLLAGAGLFARSLVAALRVNPGFDAGRLVSTSVSLSRTATRRSVRPRSSRISAAGCAAIRRSRRCR
jgi:putative ABC transport system permease protein